MIAPGDGTREKPTASQLGLAIPGYKLRHVIGQGSYGQVWLAETLTGSAVAVKVVWRSSTDGGRAFDREYRGIQNYEPISRLHQSLVHILHVGRDEAKGYFWYAMELADDVAKVTDVRSSDPSSTREAQSSLAANDKLFEPAKAADGYVPDTLRERLRMHQSLPFEDCLALGLQLTDALEQLHSRSFVHRDVKPSNIIYVHGRPKLTDIGLVARSDATASWVGTDGYAPPVGIGTAQGDLFGLGKVLYEAASGKDRLDYPEPATRIESGDPEAWAELNEIILKACAKPGEPQYSSAREMHQELESLRAGRSIRRLRQTERRLAVLRRGFFVVGAVALALSVAFLFQRRETSRLAQISKLNKEHVRQLQVANGIRAMNDGDMSASLVWLTEALKNTDPSTRTEELQRFRWGAVWQNCARLSQIGVHNGFVNSVTFSSDEKRIVTASSDQTARVWDAGTGKMLAQLKHEAAVNDADIDPNGTKLATCSEDGTARIWDAVSGELLTEITHGTNVWSVRFCANGTRLVSCGDDGAARLWDVGTGQLIATPVNGPTRLHWLEVSPNKQFCAVASDDGNVGVWSCETGLTAGPPLQHPDRVRHITFSPDGTRLLTASRDGIARVWDWTTGKIAGVPMVHDVSLWFAYFSHDGERILAGGGAGGGGEEGGARVWDFATGKAVSPPIRFNSRVRCGEFSPDDTYVALGLHDGRAMLLEAPSGRPVVSPLRHANSVWSVVFSSNGRQLLTGSRDGTWRLWDLAATARTPSVYHHPRPIKKLHPIHGGTHILTEEFSQVLLPALWTPKEHMARPVADPTLGRSTATAVSKSGALLAVAYLNRGVGLYLLPGGNPVRFISSPDLISNLAFDPAERRLLSTHEHKTNKMWDVPTGKIVFSAMVQDDYVWSLAFTPDGERIVCGSGTSDLTHGGALQIWSARTGLPLAPLIKLDGVPMGIEFSADGRWLLSSVTDGTPYPRATCLRDALSGAPVGPLLWHSDGVACVAFSPDGSSMATGGDEGEVRVWQLPASKAKTPWVKQRQAIVSLSFNNQGTKLLAASEKTAQIWDATTGEPLSPPFVHEAEVGDARFLSADTEVVTGDNSGKCQVWQLEPTKLPLDQLHTIAQLHAGVTIDSTGGFTKLTTSELHALHTRLREADPAILTSSLEQKVAWHRSHAADAAAKGNKRSARFHLDRLLELSPGDPEFVRKHAQIGIP